MKKTDELIKFENERLFGENVDIFKSYYACKFISNILKKIGTTDIHDTVLYSTLAKHLSNSEVSTLYDAILKPRDRTKMTTSMHFSNPPEIMEDGSSECLEYLGKNIIRRQKMWRMIGDLYDIRVAQYKEKLEAPDYVKSSIAKRIDEIKQLFSLSDLETEIILIIYFSDTSFIRLGDFGFERFSYDEKIIKLSKILGVQDFEISELLSDRNNIGKFGLVDNDLELEATFRSFLSGISDKVLSERFWTKYEGDALPWDFHGKLAEKHGIILQNMINSKDKNGLNILLYGIAGGGKTSFAISLAKTLGKDLYFIAQNDNDSREMRYTPAFRYAALSVAQKQLDLNNAILVVDECDKMVENCGFSDELFSMFGIEVDGKRDGEAKGQLNEVMDQNQHTVLWICNSKQKAIDPSSRRRFDYSVFFDDLSSSTRKYIWENALNFHNCSDKLSKYFIEKISQRYKVNPGGIAIAVKNAAQLCLKNKNLDFETETLKVLKAHCSLLGIGESLEEKMEVARDYTLNGLNIHSGIKLNRLIEVCKNFLKSNQKFDINRDKPRMNLLLFGVPGSGKTEFVKYLAKELDKKLFIKNASDILGCYIGQTEQRIVSAFAEAEANDDILFIDEGDSLLSSRDNAVRTFEVSQVNTLLTEMERFRGIFIVSTNLIQRLDQAALRRFSFRFHFDYLDNKGKEIFFKNYFSYLNLGELTSSELKSLHDIEKMTPSDFRNTRQQFFYLEDSNLSNKEIIEALEVEVTSKNSGSDYKGLGNIVTKMGF